jgi:hypothetical protein
MKQDLNACNLNHVTTTIGVFPIYINTEPVCGKGTAVNQIY